MNHTKSAERASGLPRRAALLLPHGLALALVALCTGCIVIPTPEYDSGTARANLKKETAARIQPGISTRADVILALGEPDAVSADERRMAYRAEKVVAVWIAGGGYSAASGEITRDRYLVVEFDEKGVVQNRQASSQLFLPSTPDKLLETKGWREAGAASLAETASVCGTAEWFPKVEGFKELVPAPGQYLRGYLALTDQAARFWDSTQMGNTEPQWCLPYANLTECHLAKFALNRRVVLQTKSGEVHSFAFTVPSGWRLDKKKTLAACAFIQAKLNGMEPDKPR